jgi:hypothetical protein
VTVPFFLLRFSVRAEGIVSLTENRGANKAQCLRGFNANSEFSDPNDIDDFIESSNRFGPDAIPPVCPEKPYDSSDQNKFHPEMKTMEDLLEARI